jgi:hypothetical protein
MYLYLSSYGRYSKEIPTAICRFSGSDNSAVLLIMHYLEPRSQNFKMAAPNRLYLYLSLFARQQRNFNCYLHVLGLGNTVALLVMLYLETGSEKFKIAAAKPEVHVSQLQYNIAQKFILFSGSGNSMTLSKGSMSKRKGHI